MLTEAETVEFWTAPEGTEYGTFDEGVGWVRIELAGPTESMTAESGEVVDVRPCIMYYDGRTMGGDIHPKLIDCLWAQKDTFEQQLRENEKTATAAMDSLAFSVTRAGFIFTGGLPMLAVQKNGPQFHLILTLSPSDAVRLGQILDGNGSGGQPRHNPLITLY